MPKKKTAEKQQVKELVLNDASKAKSEETIENKSLFEKIKAPLKEFFDKKYNNIVVDTNEGAKRAKKIGVITVVILFLFFGLWANIAPLDSAIVASGTVVVDTNKKTVQHLEGGIIKQILVKDGDYVKEGQELIILASDTAQSRYDFLYWRKLVESATLARLRAEQLMQDKVNFPVNLLNTDNEEIKKILKIQEDLFKVRTESINQTVDILQQRVAQLNKQINGLNAQQKSAKEQIKLIKEELKTAQILLEKGLEQKPRILGLKRQEAELDGRIGELVANIAKSMDAINETKLQIINTKTEWQKETANLIKESENVIAQINEEIISAKDIFDRTVITASRNGIVTNLLYHTIGGVIAPGAAILDIVPLEDDLVIEAKVMPNDIDNVTKNLDTKVMLTAFGVRYLPRLKGKVVDVSPDLIINQNNNEAYYKARVEISKSTFEELQEYAKKEMNKDIQMYPGMPVEVFIVTDASTLMKYLIYPFKASMRRAFVEGE